MASHDFYDGAELAKQVVVNATDTEINLITKNGDTILATFPPRGLAARMEYETVMLAGLPVRGNEKMYTLPSYNPGQITIVQGSVGVRILMGHLEYPGIVLTPDETADVTATRVTHNGLTRSVIRGYYRFQVVQRDTPPPPRTWAEACKSVIEQPK